MAERGTSRRVVARRLSLTLAQAQRVLPVDRHAALVEQVVEAGGDTDALSTALAEAELALADVTADAADQARTYEGLTQTVAEQIRLANQRLKGWQSVAALVETQQAPASAVKRLVDAMLLGTVPFTREEA